MSGAYSAPLRFGRRGVGRSAGWLLVAAMLFAYWLSILSISLLFTGRYGRGVGVLALGVGLALLAAPIFVYLWERRNRRREARANR